MGVSNEKRCKKSGEKPLILFHICKYILPNFLKKFVLLHFLKKWIKWKKSLKNKI